MINYELLWERLFNYLCDQLDLEELERSGSEKAHLLDDLTDRMSEMEIAARREVNT